MIKTVCFGEILWDIFPDRKTPGGAPFNVAYHLKRLGADANMISAIGHDSLGTALLRHLRNWQIDDRYIQQTLFPTGSVLAQADERQEVHYTIMNNVAWDHIAYTNTIVQLVQNADVVIFGSLATRNAETRETLHRLLADARLSIFDINLRPPFIDKKEIISLMHKASIVKMNQEEAEKVLEWSGIKANGEEECLDLIKKKYALKCILLTKSAHGAAAILDDAYCQTAAFPVSIKDTVGSGDAFLAGFTYYYLNQPKAPALAILQFAAAMGAFITNHYGACPTYSKEEFLRFYQKLQVESGKA